MELLRNGRVRGLRQKNKFLTLLTYPIIALYSSSMEPERRGQCRQRLEIAGFISSACRLGELTPFLLPRASAVDLGHYDPSAFNG